MEPLTVPQISPIKSLQKLALVHFRASSIALRAPGTRSEAIA